MQTVAEVYDRYRIMPGLQMHQLRVAGVGVYICERFKEQIDSQIVKQACLVHDMGNIIKADLVLLPHLLEPQGLAYWQKVRDEYIATYGENEHDATRTIVKEIGLPEVVSAIVDEMGFSKMEIVVETDWNELLVLEYADMRVGPDGVLSLDDRLAEGRRRYTRRNHELGGVIGDERYERFVKATHKLEKLILEKAEIRPEEITDEAIAPILKTLRDYTIG